MPVPRTPNAPYFDEHGPRAFLARILEHGLDAGITNADELVSYIVFYSSDRVREIIRYMSEFDVDEPKRTWSAAKEQILLLYGSSDEDRRTSERELIEFCRAQSAKSLYHDKLEVEQYLRDFQFIAAPLVKQGEITVQQRDFYFVSGIPTSLKDWFISRVPESQRTRSNPIPLSDSLSILYERFDPDSLLSHPWNRSEFLIAPPPDPVPVPTTSCLRVQPSTKPVSIASAPEPSTPTPTAPVPTSTTLTLGLNTPTSILSDVQAPTSTTSNAFKPEAVFPIPQAHIAPISCSSPPIELISPDLEHAHFRQQSPRAEDKLKVSPSDELPDNIVCRIELCAGEQRIIDRRREGSPIYFCGTNQTTDHFSELDLKRDGQALELDDPSCDIDWCSDFRDLESEGIESDGILLQSTAPHDTNPALSQSACELRRILDQVSSLQDFTSLNAELSLIHYSLESNAISTDEFHNALTEIARQVHEELQRRLADASSNYAESQISPSYPFDDHDSSTVTGSDIDSIFDCVPDSMTDLDTEALSPYSEYRDVDHALDTDVNTHGHWFPCDVQVIEPGDLSCSIGLYSDSRDPNPEAITNQLALSEHLTLSTASFNEVSDHVAARISFEQPSLYNAEPTELDTVSCAAMEIESTPDSHEHIIAESRFSVPHACYVDFFVPELFDIQADIRIHEPAEFPYRGPPENVPPGYHWFVLTLVSSFSYMQVRIKAEYLPLTFTWIMLCWKLISEGLWLIMTAFRVLVHEGFTSEIVNSVVIDSSELTGNPDEFGDGNIDVFAEPAPPDKILHSHFDSFIHSKDLLRQNIVRDTPRLSSSPQVQDTELENLPDITDWDSIQSHRQDFQHSKCSPFYFF
ncbi:hypothetical protein MVEN_01824600 [Mycena venus]|uniref:Uncharacterized protein n=1 Tax=Mycena venus TaxID=2733690 RepID=A0A8H6XIX4_9AGAR|nr:hypothetical protein MVEN_01824600 [Mycena venus]